MPVRLVPVSFVTPEPEELFLANLQPREQAWPNYTNEENFMGSGEKKVTS